MHLNIWCVCFPRRRNLSGSDESNIKALLISKSLRSSHPKVFLRKGVPKICSKFTGEHPCRSVISINLQSNFIEITLRHGCSPVNLLHIFRIPFPRNTSGWLLLKVSEVNTCNLGYSCLYFVNYAVYSELLYFSCMAHLYY